MSFLFPALLFLVFIACVAFVFGEGMWGAALRLVNVVFAALLATNFWEPLARLLEGISAAPTYWWDFLSLWMIFSVSLLLLRMLTRSVSQVQVRFLSLADRIGGGVFAVCVGLTMVAFTTFSFHTAPLGEKFMFGGFDPNDPVIGKPDRQWLGFVLHASKTSLSHAEDNPFPTTFISTYAARRAALEAVVKSKNAFLVSSGGAPARSSGPKAAPPAEDAGDEESPDDEPTAE
jgi:hypothetical protein